MQIDFVKRWLSRILVALTVTAVYLYGYPSATISYFVVDLFHVAIGIVLTSLLFFTLYGCSATNHCWPVWAGSRWQWERSSESC